jgi:site-specific DNA recombinase
MKVRGVPWHIGMHARFGGSFGSVSGASCLRRRRNLNKRAFGISVICAVIMTNTWRQTTIATSAHSSAAIYCRVSTRQQAEDGSSLDSQEVACRRLAASQGFTVTQVFKEDFPGTELARPMLDQLRGGVKSGAYAAVFCYATDRLSRSPLHLALIAEECHKCDVELVFVTELLDSSPEGQLLTFVRGWAAQLEREKIKDRTIRGEAARIASGRLPQGTGRTGTAYGYRYDKATGRRTIEPAEAVVTIELF